MAATHVGYGYGGRGGDDDNGNRKRSRKEPPADKLDSTESSWLIDLIVKLCYMIRINYPVLTEQVQRRSDLGGVEYEWRAQYWGPRVEEVKRWIAKCKESPRDSPLFRALVALMQAVQDLGLEPRLVTELVNTFTEDELRIRKKSPSPKYSPQSE